MKATKRSNVLMPIAAVLAAATIVGGAATARLRFNVSPSMPRGLYRAVEERLVPGAIVSACVPLAAATLARERQYLPGGDCPGGVAPVLKTLLAGPGDTIEYTEQGLRRNGQQLRNTAPFDRDSLGRALARVPFGTYHLVGEYWLYSSHHPRSWDSRYWGPVPRTAIRETAAPLWTEAEP